MEAVGVGVSCVDFSLRATCPIALFVFLSPIFSLSPFLLHSRLLSSRFMLSLRRPPFARKSVSSFLSSACPNDIHDRI